MADNKANFTAKRVASISQDMSLHALACSQSCSTLYRVQFPCGFQIAEVSWTHCPRPPSPTKREAPSKSPVQVTHRPEDGLDLRCGFSFTPLP